MKDFMKTIFPPPILEQESEKCISIYMPTHRTAPDNRQDLLRFKNIVNDLEDRDDLKAQVKKLKELEKSLDFWLYNLDGLAILMNEDDMNIYRMPLKVVKHVSVGERFYIKPLIQHFQSDKKFYVLGLARDNFKLYFGSQHGFNELEIPEEDRLLEHVLGDQYDKSGMNIAVRGKSEGSYFGYGAKRDGVRIDTERFFNYVDKYVADNYIKTSKTPLVLISLKEHQALFRNISKNQYLLEEGIERSYESLNEQELKHYLTEFLKARFNDRAKELVKSFQIGINKDQATNTIQTTLDAIINNRVHTLVIEANKLVLGKINVEDSSFKLDEEGEDILNHLAQLAIESGSEVVILPKETMPDHVSVFSILRY